MRLLLVTANYPPAEAPCGVGDYTRCLRAAFDRLGHDTVIITSVGSHATEPGLFRLPGTWGGTDLARGLRLVQEQRPDAVFLQYTPEHYGFGSCFKLLPFLVRMRSPGTRFVTTFHTLVGGSQRSKLNAVLLAAGSHGLVSTNAELSSLFRRHLPLWAQKLREIPIGANIPSPGVSSAAARRELRRRLKLAPDTPIIGTFGFAAPGKGLDTLVRSLSRLDGAVQLVCVGEARAEDRPYRAFLDSLAAGTGVAARLHWLGGIPGQEVADLLAGVDAYVVPYDEGASLRRGTLLAGFRVGVPIVTTTPRYPDAALRTGETILAVPPCSAQALADAIRRLLADGALRECLSRGAAEASLRFDWTAIAAAHTEFCRALSRRGRARP